MKINTKFINIYGTAGVGKTSIGSLITGLLSANQLVVEQPEEVPKYLFLDQNKEVFNDPMMMYMLQKRKVDVLENKCHFVINNNPSLLELVYGKNKTLDSYEYEKFKEFLLYREYIKSKNSINLYIYSDEYKAHDMFDTLQIKSIDDDIQEMLNDLNVKHQKIKRHPLVSLEILNMLNKDNYLNLNDYLIEFLKNSQSFIKNFKNLKNDNLISLKDYKILDLYGGPGVGKSTTSHTLTGLMGCLGLTTFAPEEIPKEYVWRQHFKPLDDQLFIFAQQRRKLNLLTDNCDFIVSDSPILMQLIYLEKSQSYNPDFADIIKKEQKTSKRFSVFLNRKHKYQEIGRMQNEEESNQISYDIKNMLKKENVDYLEIDTHPLIGFELINILRKEKILTINSNLVEKFIDMSLEHIQDIKKKQYNIDI